MGKPAARKARRAAEAGAPPLTPSPSERTQRPEREERETQLPDLDRLIHERIRLGLVSALAAHEPLTFAELKALLGTTDGNLSVHARKLEDAGYVSCKKTFDERTPRTEYRLTKSGRAALERYIGHMEALIRHARGT